MYNNEHEEGLDFLKLMFEKFGWYWESHPTNGDVLMFRNPSWKYWYSGTIDQHLHENGKLVVHKEVLMGADTDRIFHVNPSLKSVAWYGVDCMRDVFNLYNPDKDYMVFNSYNTPSFVTTKVIANA